MPKSDNKTTAKRAAAAKAKPQAKKQAAPPQPSMGISDIRKDYKKTLLGRYLAKTGIPGK
ncbi:MAG TPA: hypothetical protein VNO14_03255 [Blastocatellia bacterium]|nr:hypothetical protein [Blastocatellia bacterium]